MSIVNIITRHGTAAEWAASDPVLFKGQQGYETDTGRSKYGDGSTVWNSLSYDSAISPTALNASVFAALPDPTTIGPSVAFVSDRGAAGVPAYSDGVNWRYFNDNSIIV